MKELIGRTCRCVFNLPPSEWPIAGYPAWIVIEDVAMPMVKMRSMHAGEPIWVNASVILTLTVQPRQVLPRQKEPLTPSRVRELRGAYQAGQTVTGLAKQAGVNKSTMSRLLRFQTHKGA